MKSTNYSLNTNQTNNRNSNPEPWTAQSLAAIRTTARDFANPVDYEHPYPSMASFADHLALSYDANRTRHSYYANCGSFTSTWAAIRQTSPRRNCATTSCS